MNSILIVDDLESIHEMLDAVVQPIGLTTAFAKDGQTALELFKEKRFPLVLTDINMSPMDGMELLQELKAIDPNVLVIMMSGYANTDNAMQSLRLGAFDYITKPFKVDQLMSAINRAQDVFKTRAKDGDVNEGDPSLNFIGDSPSIQKLRKSVEKLSSTTNTVLIEGEKKKKKSLVASLLRKAGENEEDSEEERPYVTLSCKKLSEEELKDSLVGPEQKGGSLFQEARGGILFIRDIESLASDIQNELGTIISELKDEVRVVCSTCQNLEAMTDKGEFDESLYFRISSSPLKVPSLRERADDIPIIARAILNSLEMEEFEISDRAKALLAAYQWPGNYTELKQSIEEAAAQCENQTIRAKDLPEKIHDMTSWPSLTDYVEGKSREYMTRVLQACKGDSSKAAEILQCEEGELASLEN